MIQSSYEAGIDINMISKFRGLQAKFDTIATINDAIGTKIGEEYTWENIMQ